jgi:hypothetical protein
VVHANAMLVACRLAGLSAFEGHYAGVKMARAMRADAGAPCAGLGDVAAKMTADQIAEAQRLAREWKPK